MRMLGGLKIFRRDFNDCLHNEISQSGANPKVQSLCHHNRSNHTEGWKRVIRRVQIKDMRIDTFKKP